MSIALPFSDPKGSGSPGAVLEFVAPGSPPSAHLAEADLFSRQAAMPGHDQARLEEAHIAVIGCGGLGSWIALGLARMGARRLTLIDPDTFDRTNAPRQFVFGCDLGAAKAHALAKNLLPHMTNAGTISAIVEPFDVLNSSLGDSIDALVVGVDNNRTRLEASRFARRAAVPAVFAMLSRDGLRAQVFLQLANGPCLACVLPNLDIDTAAPCAAASIASCFLAGAHALELTVLAIGDRHTPAAWRETSLDGSTERASSPLPRADCLHGQ